LATEINVPSRLDQAPGFGAFSPSLIRVHDVTANGKLTNGKLFHDFSDTKGGLSDDIRCDENGNIWICALAATTTTGRS
jgi:sugar lactone lactonase YvrE